MRKRDIENGTISPINGLRAGLRNRRGGRVCIALRCVATKAKGPALLPGLSDVRPAWASTWRWKSSRELVTASEANRRASDREAGVKEAGSEAAGRRTGTG